MKTLAVEGSKLDEAAGGVSLQTESGAVCAEVQATTAVSTSDAETQAL